MHEGVEVMIELLLSREGTGSEIYLFACYLMGLASLKATRLTLVRLS